MNDSEKLKQVVRLLSPNSKINADNTWIITIDRVRKLLDMNILFHEVVRLFKTYPEVFQYFGWTYDIDGGIRNFYYIPLMVSDKGKIMHFHAAFNKFL